MSWTWPLAIHLRDAIPGEPGDNYSFLWNLWWMRHVLATPDLAYFHTTYLFSPFGTNLVDSSHTALPAIIAATVFGRWSVVTAQNVLLLIDVFANMAGMYALAWDITVQRLPAIIGAVLFGLSPYLAAHLPGHFELMAAWLLPAFALLLRRAVHRSSVGSAVGAGVVLTAAAYTVYYYVAYMGVFAVVYVLAWSDAFAVTWPVRPRTPFVLRLRRAFAGGIVLCAAGALIIVATGGGVIAAGPIAISATRPQNPLSLMWACALGWVVCARRPTIGMHRLDGLRRALAPMAIVVAVFLVGSAPLILEAAQVIRHGEYVTPEYQWRSAPRGVDLLAPLLGHPLHPLTQAVSRRAYAAAHLDVVESTGWLGVVPVLLVFLMRPRASDRRDDLIWRVVGGAFAVWALGPFLTIFGFDTGLRLPAILMRFVPIVANARMPGRAMIGVSMALAVLIATRMSRATGRLRSPAIQWLVIALVVFEYFDAPIALTPLDRPAVYRTLARQAPGAVCEVPFGVGGGLNPGVGAQDRRILFYATLHEHPIAGGYIGRMPKDTAERYERMPIAGALLRLSDGRPEAATASTPIDLTQSPCRYVVVNRASSSAALLEYVGRLPVDLIESADGRDLYRLR